MDQFSLTVTFLGLISFVPAVENGKSVMWVLLPYAEDAKPPCPHAGGGHEGHYAAMRYRARNLAGAPLPGSDADAWVLRHIRFEDIRVEAGPMAETLPTAGCQTDGISLRRVVRDVGASGVEPLAASTCDRQAFDWVAKLDDVAKGYGQICEHCLDDPPLTNYPWNPVGARLKLTQGLLRTERLSQKTNGGYLAYQYPAGLSPVFKSVVGEDVSLRIDGLTQPVAFVLKRRDGGTDRIALGPSTSGENVEVQILNKPGWALLGAEQPEHSHTDLRDFRFYYRLSRRALDCGQTVPILKPGPGTMGPPICPTAVMSQY